MYISLSGAADNPVIKAVEVDRNTTFPIKLSYGGTTNYNQGEYVAQIAVDNSLVSSYNSTNNTSYLQLPEGSLVGQDQRDNENGSRISDPIVVTLEAQKINFNMNTSCR